MAQSLSTTVLIALAGACGTLLRHWVGLAASRWSQAFPWGTLMINVSGSFLIGFFGALTLAGGRFQVSETTRLVFMAGLCGGYTTFSSFTLQTLDLLRNGMVLRACLNLLVSVILGMAAVSAGYYSGQALREPGPVSGPR